jgi:hypothetical protein
MTAPRPTLFVAVCLGLGGGTTLAAEAPSSASSSQPTAAIATAPPATIATAPPAVVATAPAGTTLAETTQFDAGEPAAGEPAEEEEWWGMPCVIIGRPGCGTQPHIELGMGWGESSSYVGTQWSYHGFIEAGMLVGLSPDWQLGPVAELGFDVGRVNSGYTLSPKLKARYWIGGWYISVDGAVGATFERFTFDGGWESGTREGLTAELALTVLGAIGPYAAVYQLGDPGGLASTETRWIIGFRGSVASWGLALGALGEGMSGGIWL